MKNLSEKFMTKYTIQEMSGEGSLEKVKEFLDAELKEKDLEKAVRKWRELRSCKRKRGEDIGDYMDRFEGSYLELKSAMPTTEIPQELRAVIMYDGAGVEGLEETVLLGKVDMGTKDTLLAQMEKAMKDVLGPGPCGRKKEETIEGVVRVEAVRRSENESCLWVGEKKYKQVKMKKMKNKKGEDGQPMKCFTCKSEYHFSSDCPKTKEEEGKEGKKRKKKSKFKRRDSSTSSSGAEDESLLMVQEQEYILAAGSISSFTWEARGAAALDSCCTASVSGQVWMDMFLEELEEEDREKVEGPFKSKKSFGFGNNGELKSQKYYIIPVEIARKRTRMKVEIIQSDIPLLMSRKSMEKAGIVLDFKEKKITVFGTTLPMLQTRSGHPVLRVQPNLNKSFEEALLVTNFKTGTRAEQRKGMIKLHRQFGHMPVERFVGFLKSTGVEWHPEMEQDLREIMDGCVGCLQRKRNPDLPAVAMPMATRFNEKVAVDLKVWGEEKYILYMVDLWSKMTQAAIITRKQPKQVVNEICLKWVGHYGIMGTLMHDCGGEFTGQDIKEMCRLFNVIDTSSAGYAPWQNGICEKHHATVDDTLERLAEDHPGYPLEVLLAWALMVKNSAYDQHGFSPNQLVYGTNPVLPNVFTEGVSALDQKTTSETLAMHMNALQAARVKFNEALGSAKVRTALKKKVRTNNTVFEKGDRVFWRSRKKKKGLRKWDGPGRVICQDGKIVFVRDGIELIRVSVNRLLKAGQEFGKMREAGEGLGDRDQCLRVKTSYFIAALAPH